MNPVDVVVLGSYVQDHCWVTETFPGDGESRIGRFSTGPGGKGFNQAVACQRQGVATLFLGAIGRDALGATARAYAADSGLAAIWEEREDASTAASSILVDARGQNRIVVALGANEKLSVAFVAAHRQAIHDARVLVCQLESDLPSTREALASARRHGTLTLLNPAPINAGVSAELLALADILTPNETEFAFLLRERYGQAVAPTYWELADAQLHALCRATGIPTVVITLGDKGCFVSHADAATRGDAEPYYRLPAEPARCVDTTGAGDAYSGGLAAGLVHFAGQPFRRAATHANRVAALSVEQPGTAPAMPTREAVRARFGD